MSGEATASRMRLTNDLDASMRAIAGLRLNRGRLAPGANGRHRAPARDGVCCRRSLQIRPCCGSRSVFVQRAFAACLATTTGVRRDAVCGPGTDLNTSPRCWSLNAGRLGKRITRSSSPPIAST